MKNVLIVGGNSYLGKELAIFLEKREDFKVGMLSVRDNSWKKSTFEGVDAIYYVAAIVHRNEKEIGEEEYYRVNCDLPLEVANKAKREGVKQFIFTSTMSVYGMLMGTITLNTVTTPANIYGKSKLKAEEELLKLQTSEFSIAIVRPPMIYGKGCKGNFVRLRQLALLCPFFPDVFNQRSMLYIENLNFFVEQLILQKKGGIFFPQDSAYVNTFEMVKLIREANGKKLYGVRLFNPIIGLLQNRISIFQKVWGSLCYELPMSEVDGVEYQKKTLAQAIREIES